MAFLNLPLSDVLNSKKPEQKEPAVKQRRNYTGAIRDRLTSSWVAPNSSADSLINGSNKILRQRAREVIRNNPWGRNAARQIVSNVVGPNGFKLQSSVKKLRGQTLDNKINNAIESKFKKWSNHKSCDVAGRSSFVDICRLVMMAMITDGECLIRIIKQPFGKSSIPFALQILEGDMLDDDYSGRDSKGSNWKMGIRQDKWGRALEYCFFSKHPGETAFPSVTGQQRHVLVPADEVIHLFVPDRSSQSRGVTQFASSLQSLHHIDGYANAALTSARANACLQGFIENKDPELDNGGEVLEEERITDFQPGTFHYLNPNESINIPDMDSPNKEFPEFMRAMLRSVAASVGIGFESVSKDFSQSNYSSSRLSLLEDRAQYRAIQNYLIEHFLEPVYENFIEMSVLSGNLNLPNYETDSERYQQVRFVPRGFSFIDPQREVAAAKESIKAGFKTVTDIVSEQGGDINEVIATRADELDKMNQLNLVFDTDIAATSTINESNINTNDNQDSTNGEQT